MPTAHESRRALTLVTAAAVGAAHNYLASLSGSPEEQRAGLLDAVPEIIGYYSLGSSALAADFYEDRREEAGVRGRFTAEPAIPDRLTKIRRALAWVAEPFFTPDVERDARARLAEVVQLETARPYRDTILTNTSRDPAAVGWKRVTRADSCKFCLMVAAKGAIYKRETARFAAHDNCGCTAQPWFRGEPQGPEASALQYVASGRRRSAKEKSRLRDYLNATYPDAHG